MIGDFLLTYRTVSRRMILNLTDGQPTDANPRRPGELKALKSHDGNPVVFNAHSRRSTAAPDRLSERRDELPDVFAKALFRMSSILAAQIDDLRDGRRIYDRWAVAGSCSMPIWFPSSDSWKSEPVSRMECGELYGTTSGRSTLSSSFSVPKQGNSVEQNEDACAWDCDTGRFAVSDGALGEHLRRRMGQDLTDDFIADAPRETTFGEWLVRTQNRWVAEMDSRSGSVVRGRKNPGRGVCHFLD